MRCDAPMFQATKKTNPMLDHEQKHKSAVCLRNPDFNSKFHHIAYIENGQIVNFAVNEFAENRWGTSISDPDKHFKELRKFVEMVKDELARAVSYNTEVNDVIVEHGHRWVRVRCQGNIGCVYEAVFENDEFVSFVVHNEVIDADKRIDMFRGIESFVNAVGKELDATR